MDKVRKPNISTFSYLEINNCPCNDKGDIQTAIGVHEPPFIFSKKGNRLKSE
jgi:hypothetical protein